MGALGGWEILIIFMGLLLLFGPKKLPEMRSTNEDDQPKYVDVSTMSPPL